MPRGFLAVLSEPGEVGLDEFHGKVLSATRSSNPKFLDLIDWYNNEHIPLRLNHMPTFLTGARFRGADGQKPGWIALYDIDSTATFADPSYTRLRENRSPREAAVVKRLDVLDRRTCEVVFETENEGTKGLSTGLALDSPTQWIVTHGLDINAEEDVKPGSLEDTWRSITTVGMATKGLLRSRLLRCIDSLKTGVTISSSPEAQRIPKYFVLHGASLCILRLTVLSHLLQRSFQQKLPTYC
jgi:hypothetical protein